MQKALFLGYVWPEPKTTAAGHRMVQLLESFIANGYEITFATTAQETSYSEKLLDLNIKTQKILLNDATFDDFVGSLNPDVVVFDRFMVEEQFGWRVAQFAPNALRILNTEDLHSLRSIRQACIKANEAFTNAKWLKEDITKREIASIYRSDLTLMISQVETQLLQSVFGITESLLLTLPFLLDTISKEAQAQWPAFEDRQDFIFIGNGKHAPNVDAVKYLKADIWPLVRKELPNVKLNIYGAYLPQQITEIHEPKDGFLVHGWGEDLNTVMQNAKINLAPLRFGAGLKGKVVDGMQNGTPTITTAVGAEGIPEFKAYENPKEFSIAAINSYNNKAEWLKMQKAGVAIINKHFAKQNLAFQLFKTITSLKNTLAKHRSHNFIGSLLQHQTMASTKFMGKWIEEKNTKR
ncbi:glycosyltransferase family 4 protein [Croceitalea sp. MTPC9]|uniref:glycosyltransferase n=1 Tax=unclassified Croceitalea TaxID=2632280 RepID=UPI002B3EE807|nr:glycosyltransferase family 4 protein [Croceitalea sp. MTPC6]GMN15748.1 glycosyltransferase family 4 protein [Croceitalea sp. MTPC9]